MTIPSPYVILVPESEPGTSAAPDGRAWAGAIKVASATILFGIVHSLLASSWAKSGVGVLFGERVADGLYRPVYVVLSLVLVGVLAWYVRRQPGRDLYRVRGPVAWAMRAGQAAALAYAGWALYHVGLDFMTGWDNLAAWWRGAGEVPRMPDGQGPSPGGDGTMRATGPFAHTRHPLNWFLLPLLWLNPRMTTRLLAFNLVVTVYALLGSVLVELHLADAYGDAYRRYQESVPFLVPGTPTGPVPATP